MDRIDTEESNITMSIDQNHATLLAKMFESSESQTGAISDKRSSSAVEASESISRVIHLDPKPEDSSQQKLRENRAQTHQIQLKKDKPSIQRFISSNLNEQEQSQRFDRYGFTIESKIKSTKTHDEFEKKKKELALRENARIEKWRKMLPTLETMVQKKNKKLKQRIRKGIPDSLRGRVWPLLAKAQEVKKQHPEIDFEKLANATDAPSLDMIRRDVPRTFPGHTFFQSPDGLESLERVLKAVSLVFKDLPYCQGMNFLCGVLVIYCNDEEAFWIMISLLQNYGMLKLYTDPNHLRKYLYVLDHLIQPKIQKLKIHFMKNDMESVHFAVSWWMTLFTGAECLPFSVTVRIFEIILSENLKILYRASLAFLKVKEKEILANSRIDRIASCIKEGLKGTDCEGDDDKFFKAMFNLKLKRKEINDILIQGYKETFHVI